jgi:FKBP-type peptidyl-prolyl cis-trans isomerase FklB
MTMNKLSSLAVLFGALFLIACGQESASSGSSAEMKTDIDTISYSLGITFASGIKERAPFDLNPAMIEKAVRDVFGNTPGLTVQEAEQNLIKYGKKLEEETAKKKIDEGRSFLEDNSKMEGVVTLPSGLQYMVVREGDGPKPKFTDRVTTHYRGTLINGTVFDSSYERGQPATFAVNGVIAGWTEALQLMKVGAKWKLFIPSELAYGQQGGGQLIGPNEVLIFDVELLSIDSAADSFSSED